MGLLGVGRGVGGGVKGKYKLGKKDTFLVPVGERKTITLPLLNTTADVTSSRKLASVCKLDIFQHKGVPFWSWFLSAWL